MRMDTLLRELYPVNIIRCQLEQMGVLEGKMTVYTKERPRFYNRSLVYCGSGEKYLSFMG